MVFTFLMQREAASFFFFFFFANARNMLKASHAWEEGIFRAAPLVCVSLYALASLVWRLPRLRWPGNAKENAAFPAGWFKSFHCLQTHSLLLVKSFKLKHLFYLWTGSYSCRVIFEPWTDVHSERRPRGRICWIGSCVRGGDESGRTG